jgi:hypothetical protein
MSRRHGGALVCDERAKRVAPVLAAEAGRPRLTALKLSPYAASSHDRVTAALGAR